MNILGRLLLSYLEVSAIFIILANSQNQSKKECVKNLVESCKKAKYEDFTTMMNKNIPGPSGAKVHIYCYSKKNGTNCSKKTEPWFSCSQNHSSYYKSQLLSLNSIKNVDEEICWTSEMLSDGSPKRVFILNMKEQRDKVQKEVDKDLEPLRKPCFPFCDKEKKKNKTSDENNYDDDDGETQNDNNKKDYENYREETNKPSKKKCVSRLIETCKKPIYPSKKYKKFYTTDRTPSGKRVKLSCYVNRKARKCYKDKSLWFACSPNHCATYKGKKLTKKSYKDVDDEICYTAKKLAADSPENIIKGKKPIKDSAYKKTDEDEEDF